MKTYRITVTLRDIATGKPGVCEACPVAKAARRVFRQPVLVGGSTITVNNDEVRMRRFALPHTAHAFIQRFDAKKPVKPFSFTVTEVQTRP